MSKREQTAGFIVDCTLVARDIAQLNNTMQLLAKVGLCGIKVTAHQMYKIQEMIRSRNAMLTCFTQEQVEVLTKGLQTELPSEDLEPEEELTSLDEIKYTNSESDSDSEEAYADGDEEKEGADNDK